MGTGLYFSNIVNVAIKFHAKYPLIAHDQRGQNITPRAGNVYSVYGTKDEFENSSCEAFHHCAFS